MNPQLFHDLAASEESSGYPANARALRAVPDLHTVLVQAIEDSGHSLSGPSNWLAAENGEPKWVCNARAALAAMDATEKEIAS